MLGATSVYMLVFRVIHVMLAIAWGGALFLLVVFLQPAAKTVGPAAGPFMRELLAVRHLTDWLLRIAGGAVVAGGFLYWHDMQLFGGLGDFLGTAFGVWLTIGRSRSAPRSPRPATSRRRTCCRSSLSSRPRAAPTPSSTWRWSRSRRSRCRRLATGRS